MPQRKIKSLILNANRVRVGYGFAFLLLLVSLGLTLYTVQKLLSRTKDMDRTLALINTMEDLQGRIVDAETGFRGFLLMNDEKFLEPYYRSLSKTDSLFTVMYSKVSNNVVLQKHADELKKLIASRFSIIDEGIKFYKTTNGVVNDSVKLIIEKGKKATDSIRAAFTEMKDDEHRLLKLRTARLNSISASIQTIIFASLLVGILLGVYSFITFNKENRARQAADAAANGYRKRLEERILELRNANAELVKFRSNEKFAATGRIARTIAHEVRNPLTNINLAAEQLKDDIGDGNESAKTMLDMIYRNSTRINQLVTELLDSTRFIELKFESKPINTLLDEALFMAADRIELNNVTVKKNYDEDICDVQVDAEKIKIAFLNIIVNAIEAMEPGKGVLTVTTLAEDGQCVVSISDNGTGMDEETLQKLFEPYFTSKPLGNGLGMTNTQNIIINHNGSITAASQPGQGTTFIIALHFPA